MLSITQVILRCSVRGHFPGGWRCGWEGAGGERGAIEWMVMAMMVVMILVMMIGMAMTIS